MVTSRDVAKLANVSVSTVSRAFRDDVYISEEKKKRVFEASEQLGYTLNFAARSLKSSKSKTIGLMISDIDNAFYTYIARIVEREIKSSGYRLLITYSNEDPAQELETLQLLASSRVDGIIFTPTSTKNRKFISQFQKQNTAFVQTYRHHYDNLDSVTVDDYKGAYIATKYFVSHGHTNIMMTEQFPQSFKIDGYKQALHEAELPNGHILCLPFQPDLKSVIHQAIVDHKPTAILSANNIVTLNILKVCKGLKLTIPDDLSIITFDDNDWVSLLGITAIAQPMEEIGQSIARILLSRLREEEVTSPPMNSRLEPILIARNSIRNLFAQRNYN
ncbi:LacI family DNA-binding transcriptional regulator [Paenibacillus sp. N3.4]|uniref:LacI family DNA-binding transcriptional regulator n=1 Tax=Paenibacillus sp. N3.4 TaxID=2603222 RepID=UPI00164EF4BD|nr:LacI family DNA-binding transcriptional regulator [Paenibacillus sp. N3.4]